MFVTRLISGIILLAILITSIVLSGPVLLVLLLAVSLIGMFELYRACGRWKGKPDLLIIIAWLGAAVYYLFVFLNMKEYLLPILMCALIGLLFVYVFSFPKYQAEDVMCAFFGIAYVAVSLSFIYLTRELPDGAFTVWLIVICSWGCDTMAYVFGRLFGKRKMAPVLSPKKSVEGAVGGVASAAVIGLIYALIAGRYMENGSNKALAFALIAAVGALISMVGDLAASAIKRNHNIKDYGKLIPGHGGILDRFDSVIITAPIIYMLALAFG